MSGFQKQKSKEGQARGDKPSGRSQAGAAGQARPYFERDPMLDQLVAEEQNKKQKELQTTSVGGGKKKGCRPRYFLDVAEEAS